MDGGTIFLALSENDQESLTATRCHPDRVARRYALWRSVREAQGGASAAESTFKCLDPGVPADPYVLEVRDQELDSDWETTSTTSTECSHSDSGCAEDSESSSD